MIICLNEHGYLPAGKHVLNLDDIKELFVDGFPTSQTRTNIWKGFLTFLQLLSSAGFEEYELLIDGSFTTSKNNPNDIDFSIMASAEYLDTLPPETQENISKICIPDSMKQHVKSTLLCDYYFCLDICEDDVIYWNDWWTHDRSGIEKGVIIYISGGGSNEV